MEVSSSAMLCLSDDRGNIIASLSVPLECASGLARILHGAPLGAGIAQK